MTEYLIEKVDLIEFARKHGREWKGISGAINLAEKYRVSISQAFPPPPLFSSDIDLVVFGSLARNECTEGSDLDWTLLIDGQANSVHRASELSVKQALEKIELAKPGTTGVFGHMTFSHDLIHYIGGQEDTNHNITQRVLMLLESEKIAVGGIGAQGTAYDRVTRGIIQQYINDDSGFRSERGKQLKVPRFLLNDIIRFWRTMCVDFAYKQREQDGRKWALRNLKLRMSRKLIYAKGLLMCFSCYQNENLKNLADIENHLFACVQTRPLEFILSILIRLKTPEELILQLMDAYDNFIVLLNSSKRDHLEKLPLDKVYTDPIFRQARDNSDKFKEAMNRIFIFEAPLLKEFTLKYGIF
ncbi:MAG: nucleotidyltransferase domain-containing protein [Bacteroidetes bacterium]|nr:nucleotidyltransferase domain-containing protein [Bacteroidota bacterium]